tara:strand:- start:742 stop:1929 length:1188 start_codon:yes stop_codon:yes gene_type:complete
MSKTIVSYPLDLMGTMTSNFTTHDMVLGSGSFNRAFAYPTGPFFADTFKLYEASRPNVPLERGKDYQLILLNTTLRKMTTREICTAVVVYNAAVSSDVIAKAQIVGGPYAANVDAIEQCINALDLDNRQIDFSDLSGVPEEFQTAPAYSDIGDIFGFEYIITVLGQMTEVLKVGDNAAVSQLSEAVEQMRLELRQMLQSHIDSEGNVHNVTRADLSVPSVSEVNTSIQSVMTELNKLATRIGELESTDTATDKKIQAVNEAFDTVALQLTTIRQNYQRTNQNVADLSQQVSGYEDQVLQLTRTLSQTNQELADADKRLTDLSEVVEQQANQITALTQELAQIKEQQGQQGTALQDHVNASDPHPQYLNRNTGGTVHASVHIEGNLTTEDDVKADV